MKRYESHYCQNGIHTISYFKKRKDMLVELLAFFSTGVGLAYAREKYHEYIDSCRLIGKKSMPLNKYIKRLTKTFTYGKVKDTYVYAFEREND